jgi:hypothetical protein
LECVHETKAIPKVLVDLVDPFEHMESVESMILKGLGGSSNGCFLYFYAEE